MSIVVGFDSPGGAEHSLVGGKGANLAVLTQAGFPVPSGFCVTTEGYSEMLAATGLADKIYSRLDSVDFADPADVDAASAEIIGLVEGVTVPKDIGRAVTDAYGDLGDQSYVAVRSSGTAEDLAEASFAGLHDTYLDITGVDAVIDAVKRCWASLWTPRAMVYRHNAGFDQTQVRLAVVVQVMVEAEVSGVMFTANPLTSATDELVINASWGLGEAIVSGSVTPDLFVVKAGTFEVLEKTLGTKEHRVVRHRAGAGGTVEEAVPDRDRSRFCLSDRQATQLAELGQRVQAHYGGFPQDTEWALAEDSFYLLQSRPITGVEFSWDADVEAGIWGEIPEDNDTVWTRAFADEITTGAVSPLTYSVRYPGYSRGAFGIMTDVVGSEYSTTRRMFKYHKGEVYCDTRWGRVIAERMAWSKLRPRMLGWTDPREHDEILSAPFKALPYLRFLSTVLRNKTTRPKGGLRRLYDHWRSEAVTRQNAGLPHDELSRLSDTELKQYTERMKAAEDEFGVEVTLPCAFWLAGSMQILEEMIDRWYDGGNENAYLDLISGCTEQTDTLKENEALWQFAERIRNSAVLRAAFDTHEGAAFFDALNESEEGRAFLAAYEPWNQRFGHRGHADRDMIYPRRSEERGLDYQAMGAFLRAESAVNPETIERRTSARREGALTDVLANLRAKRLGRVKALAVSRIYQLMHQYIAFRDDERQNPTDLITMAYKRGFLEVGRRLQSRGLLEAADDVHYLSKQEAFGLLDGRPTNMRLVQAKIAARRRDVEQMLSGQADPPKFIHRGRVLDLEVATVEAAPGVWRGFPVSSGAVTGVARVVHKLADVGRVQQGEILVVHATDPGWTPVFLLLGGIVVETGGPLAHAACLAREYGLPAVQLERAMRLIPDGATVTVNGTSGTVTLDTDVEAAPEPEPVGP